MANTANENIIELPQDLCSLIDNPYPFHQKMIELDSILWHDGSNVTFGDENCESRHPLFDVEFAPDFASSVCGSVEPFSKELCAISKTDGIEAQAANLTVKGVFYGRFEYLITKEGFTHNGMRFRFVVYTVRGISSVTPIKVERLK